MKLNRNRMLYGVVLSIITLLLVGCMEQDQESTPGAANEEESIEALGSEFEQNVEREATQVDEQAGEQNTMRHEAVDEQELIKAEMKDEQNEELGTVYFQDQGSRVLIEADIHNLEQGWHGFHIHENGDCNPEADEGTFKSAGGHYHSGHEHHGDHEGGLPPLYANEDGTANMSVFMDRFSAQELINEELAVIIHEDPDNLGHIPDRYQSSESDSPGPDETTRSTGDAGERIGCGTVQLYQE